MDTEGIFQESEGTRSKFAFMEKMYMLHKIALNTQGARI